MLDFARRLNVFSKIWYTKNRESVHTYIPNVSYQKEKMKKDSIFMFFLVKVKQKFSDMFLAIYINSFLVQFFLLIMGIFVV